MQLSQQTHVCASKQTSTSFTSNQALQPTMSITSTMSHSKLHQRRPMQLLLSCTSHQNRRFKPFQNNSPDLNQQSVLTSMMQLEETKPNTLEAPSTQTICQQMFALTMSRDSNTVSFLLSRTERHSGSPTALGTCDPHAILLMVRTG